MKKIDLTGRRFGRLVVVGEAGRTKRGKITWECLCDCGKTTVIIGDNLRSGNTLSCGCYGREVVRYANTTHGMARTREYNIWEGMKNRCQNKTHPDYPNYGGRGIKVCSRWMSFENFFFDMGVSHGLSIDRINNDGNYEPSNCRWATASEQNLNRRICKTNKSGVTGVWKDGENWRVQFRGEYLGSSKSFRKACAMRRKAERDHFKGSDYESNRNDRS